MANGIILFELNEVPLKIVDYFVEQQPTSHLARLMRSARVYETFAEDQGHLSPWKTWPSLHRGVSNTKHSIEDFGQPLDEVDREFPPIWTLLNNAGVSVGVCGSFHSYPIPRTTTPWSFYVPDIFATGSETVPEGLQPFQALCLDMARNSGRNVSGEVPLRRGAALIRSLPKLGLRTRTVASIAKQLMDERRNAARIVRRRTHQAVMAFDVFYRQLVDNRPQFSTFFTNHVASAMHRYWAATFPHEYQSMTFDESWRVTFGGEIMFAMTEVDVMLGRVMQFVDKNPSYELIVASSMGQEAIEANPIETQLYVTDGNRLMRRFGLDDHQWEPRPAMLPQYNVLVAPEARAAFQTKLDTFAIAGQQLVYRTDDSGFYSLDFGHENVGDQDVMLGENALSVADLGLENVEIQDRSGTTAYHIPKGSLMIYRARAPGEGKGYASTLDIAPYILRNFDVAVPSYMNHPTAL